MKLSIRAQTAQNQHNNSPIALIHGLFGSLNSLSVPACDLVSDHNIVRVGTHNYGPSPRDPVMNYPATAQDLVDTPDVQQIGKTTFIGHFMGGKVVMALTALVPDCIDRPVAISIAPVDYHVCRYDETFTAINAVSESDVQARQQAAVIMRQHPGEEGATQLLLKPPVDEEWHFNVSVLWDQYLHIASWERIPAWGYPAPSVPGDNSPYISEQYRDDLLAQFLQARAHVIAGADHRVHAEKPGAVLRAIRRYLND